MSNEIPSNNTNTYNNPNNYNIPNTYNTPNNYNIPNTFNIPENYRPIGAWGYLGYQLLFSIPLVGLILMLVFAFSGSSNKNVCNFARYNLLMILLVIIIYVILFLVLGALGMSLGMSMAEYSY